MEETTTHTTELCLHWLPAQRLQMEIST